MHAIKYKCLTDLEHENLSVLILEHFVGMTERPFDHYWIWTSRSYLISRSSTGLFLVLTERHSCLWLLCVSFQSAAVFLLWR
jgi:hypothetical protein